MCNHCFFSLLLPRAIKMWKAGIKPGVLVSKCTFGTFLFYLVGFKQQECHLARCSEFATFYFY